MEYPKIRTLFERDEKTHKVNPDKIKVPAVELIKRWEFTEKIDGTNIRIMWDGNGIVRLGGKTDRAQIPAGIQEATASATAERFGSIFGGTPVVVYGEGYGPGIQKGGGYANTVSFAVFDVFVDNRWWLKFDGGVTEVAEKLGLETVPILYLAELEYGVELVRKGFNSVVALKNTGKQIPAEGIVGRTQEPLFDKFGNRLIVKLKTKDF